MRRRILSTLLALSTCIGSMAPASAVEVDAKGLVTGSAVYNEVLQTYETLHQDSVRFNPDGTVKVTGQEWLADSMTVGVNRERAHSQFIPYQDANTGLAAEKSMLDDVGRDTSSYYQLLSGKDWDFALVRNPAEAAKKDAAYLAENYTGKDFTPEYVPQAWQTYRNADGTFKYFDEPMYTNHPFPWIGNFESVDYSKPSAPTVYNPVGYYRTSFDTPANWDGREIFISLQSVESAYYLYVNGKCVGYSTDAFSAQDFNLTPYLKPAGETNTLAIKVFRWSIGSWLENQDFIRQSGIYRDVYLYSKDEAEIRDFFVKTKFTDRTSVDSDVDVTVETDVRGLRNAAAGDYTVSAYLVDGTGNTVVTADDKTVTIAAAAGKTPEEKLRDAGTKVTTQFTVTNPDKWFTDTPNLYRLVLQLKKDGEVLETAVQRIGFREIYKVVLDPAKNNEQIQITGQQIIFRGTNRHDTDLQTGHALSFEAYKDELMLMKQTNINAIRTSHYPNDRMLFDLADELGIYLCVDANVESHRAAMYGVNVPTGLTGSNGLPEWVSPVLDRTATMTERFKNHASVVVWSLGNEATYSKPNLTNQYSFWVSSMYLLARDPDRIRKYEREDNRGYTRPANTDPWSIEARKNLIVDIISSQYRTPDSTSGYNSQLPYFHSEYNHAMGQAYGNAKEHWDAIRAKDNVQGGFIWDWIDQSVETTKDSNGDGVAETFWGYGGDWIDTVANDNAFCANGLTYADRSAGPMTYEARKVHQQVSFYNKTPVAVPGEAVTVQVVNEFENTSLDAFDITWRVIQDGEFTAPMATGTLSLSTGPMKGKLFTNTAAGGNAEDVTVTLPSFTPQEGSDYLLDFSVTTKQDKPWAAAGSEIAYEQFELSLENRTPAASPPVAPDFTSVTEDGDTLTLTGTTDKNQAFSIKLNTMTGQLTEYALDGKTVMTAGPELSLWRPQTYNEGGSGVWSLPLQNAGDPLNMTGLIVDVDKSARNKVSMTASGTLQVDADSSMTLDILGNGEIIVTEQFVPKSNFAPSGLPKVGTRMVLSGDYGNFTWYGRGPWETYSDRKSGARISTYTSTVDEQYDMKLMKPQENGNHTDVRWTSLTDASGSGLMVSAGNGNVVEVAALHNTAEEINSKTYNDSDHRHPVDIKQREDIVWSIDLRQDGVGDTGFSSPYPIAKYKIPTDQDYNYSYRISPISADFDEMAKSKEPFTATLTEYQVRSISVGGVPIPGFSPIAREITYAIPSDASSAEVTAESAGDLTITMNHKNGTATVTSILDDVVQTYTIHLTRAKKQMPNTVFSQVATHNEYSGNKATNLIDGNPNTFWDFNWSSSGGGTSGYDMLELYYAVELKEPTIVSSVGYMPRQDSGQNGNFQQHQIYVSTKPISELNVGKGLRPDLTSADWTLVSEGVWDIGKNWKDDEFTVETPVKTILVQPVTAANSPAPPTSSYGNGAETRVSALRSAADATVAMEPSYALTGNAAEPDPSITVGGVKLIRGIDYTVAYENNTAAGTAKAKISYKGQFYGPDVEKTFEVTILDAQEIVFGLSVNGTPVDGFVHTTSTYTIPALPFATKDVVVTADVAQGGDYTVAMTNDGAVVTATKGDVSKSYTIKMTRKAAAAVGGSDTFAKGSVSDSGGGTTAALMFDGLSGTFWENSWSSASLDTVYFALELKDAMPLAALHYLPRQDTTQKNGRLLESSIYVSQKPISEVIVDGQPTSLTGADWTLAYAGTWPSTLDLKTADFNENGMSVKTVLVKPTATDGKNANGSENNKFACVAEVTVTPSSDATNAYVVMPDTAPLVGESAEPNPMITMGSTKLIRGMDYTVTYSDNTTAGQSATATITYQGIFAGAPTVTRSFTVGNAAGALTAPSNVSWDGTIPGKATWTAVPNATGYSIQLYKDGQARGPASIVAAGVTEKNLAPSIIESGSYTFRVKALGDGTVFSDSPLSEESVVYTYSAKHVIRLSPGAGYQMTPTEGSVSPAPDGGSYSFTLTVADSHSASTPVVKVNGEKLAATNVEGNVYSYTISDISENKTVTVTGVSKNVYTISFTVDGKAVAEKKVEYGTNLSLNNFPKVPLRTGYTGVWDRTTPFTNVTENGLVSAIYTAEQYEVDFDATGGSEVTEVMTVTYDQPYGTLPTTAQEDMTFDGWFTAAEGGSPVKATNLVKIASDHTLYAHWRDGATSEAPEATVSGMPEKVTLPYEDAGIELRVSEQDTYSYQWKRSTDGQTWQELENETSSMYLIPADDILLENSGWLYLCAVTNTEGDKHPNTAESLPVTLLIEKGFQAAPEGLTGIAPATPGGTDGAIDGLDTEKLYEYKSEDGEYASVAAGSNTITGLAQGKYLVRYAATSDYSASEGAIVTVPENMDGSAPVTSITLNQSSASLYRDYGSQTLQLVATVHPADAANKTVLWSTDNQEVATVDASGLVTVHASGTAVITAETADGGYKATCEITVTTYYTGGSSSTTKPPANTTTTETTKPDGSKETTVVDKTTGMTTVTTKAPDGSESVVKTDKGGNVTAEVKLSDKAADKIVLSMPKITPTAATGGAPAVTIKSDKPRTIIVPVTNTAESVVAVLVDASGKETILSRAVMGENGLLVPIEGNVTIKLIDNNKHFGDVAEAHWAADAVAFVTSRELFNGTAEGTFSLNDKMNRAMLMTVLYRFDGATVRSGGTEWYADALAWSKQQNISDGTNPNGPITREQLAAILYRYAGSPALADGSLTTFTDGGMVSDWATDAMSWAVQQGIITGKGDAAISPKDNATRAEVATMLQRFIKNT